MKTLIVIRLESMDKQRDLVYTCVQVDMSTFILETIGRCLLFLYLRL